MPDQDDFQFDLLQSDYKQLNYNFVSVDQIIENYKSVADGNNDFEISFSNFLKEPNGYNRANVWLSIIKIKDDIKKVNSILKMIIEQQQ